MAAPRHLLKISDFSKDEIVTIINWALDMKQDPTKFSQTLAQKVLLAFFEKPSLRTRVSLETGMVQLGGHCIYYDIANSPMGKKESISDTIKVASRMCDIVTARVNSRETLREMAQYSSVPVINALDDYAHPMQMLADLLTLVEYKGLQAVTENREFKFAFCGDLDNNVTYDLMRAAAIMGFTIYVAGPNNPEQDVVDECHELCQVSGGSVVLTADCREACEYADVIYCDSWMSYHISGAEQEQRIAMFQPYQVNSEILALAKPDCIFMNCLPAARGMEQTAEVIDGPQSVVFAQAENRLHAQKSLLLFLLNAYPTEQVPAPIDLSHVPQPVPESMVGTPLPPMPPVAPQSVSFGYPSDVPAFCTSGLTNWQGTELCQPTSGASFNGAFAQFGLGSVPSSSLVPAPQSYCASVPNTFGGVYASSSPSYDPAAFTASCTPTGFGGQVIGAPQTFTHSSPTGLTGF